MQVLNFEWCYRLIIASVCGALIGYERSTRLKNAGIRTHIIVALGAALAMLISKYGFYDVLQTSSFHLDPSRIAAQVISGIGFIGAGTILVRGVDVNGLTTAAGIWTTAAIGMAIGAGMYFVGIVAAILIVACQYIFRENFILKYILKRKHFHCGIILKNDEASLNTIKGVLNHVGFVKSNFSISNVEPDKITIELVGILTEKQDIDAILLKIANNPSVIEIYRED